jgi:ketosteroid isomerase-like protein
MQTEEEAMSREEMERLVRDVYGARLGNNLEAARNYFSPDSCFTLNGCPKASPIALSLSGKPAIDQLLTTLFETWEWLEQDIHHSLIDGDRAAVHYRLKVRFKPTGEIITTQICDLLRLRSGKLMEITQFLDTALVGQLMGQLGGSPSANAA